MIQGCSTCAAPTFLSIRSFILTPPSLSMKLCCAFLFILYSSSVLHQQDSQNNFTCPCFFSSQLCRSEQGDSRGARSLGRSDRDSTVQTDRRRRARLEPEIRRGTLNTCIHVSHAFVLDTSSLAYLVVLFVFGKMFMIRTFGSIRIRATTQSTLPSSHNVRESFHGFLSTGSYVMTYTLGLFPHPHHSLVFASFMIRRSREGFADRSGQGCQERRRAARYAQRARARRRRRGTSMMVAFELTKISMILRKFF